MAGDAKKDQCRLDHEERLRYILRAMRKYVPDMHPVSEEQLQYMCDISEEVTRNVTPELARHLGRVMSGNPIFEAEVARYMASEASGVSGASDAP